MDYDKIKLRVVICGVKLEVIVTYIDYQISLENLNKEVNEICKFVPNQPFTIKWIDTDGDPCVLSCQEELDEMLHLCRRTDNKEPEVTLHVFDGEPMMPGLPCPGEGPVYRRGGKRWHNKTYRIYGHLYEPKRLKRATCAYCQDNIWGLGSGGFRCINCKLTVHKKCYKHCKFTCSGNGERPLIENNNIANNNNNRRLNPAFNQYIHPSNFARGSSLEQRIDLGPNPAEQSSHYKLADFDILGVIGRGSYAKVLAVELKQTKRIYAMKVIKKEMFINSENEDIDWVQTEKHVFETASNYPFLVGLHSCFQNESRLFFVIEFVRGGDLMYHMQMRRRLFEHEARFYSAEISLALNYLHVRGIIYRDLKLDNVLLDHEGHIKLTDYGMCKEGMKNGEKTSTFCGTPNYISPELLRRQEYDFSVDWWALGVLLYEMLAGRSPFETTQADKEDQLFQIILEKTIRIPRDLSVPAIKILKDFLKKDPVERLGCHPKEGFNQVKCHEFFSKIDWDLLERRQVDPPYKPTTESERDLKHFDPLFTQESVNFTPPADPRALASLDQSEFYGFSYVNPLLMSVEDNV